MQHVHVQWISLTLSGHIYTQWPVKAGSTMWDTYKGIGCCYKPRLLRESAYHTHLTQAHTDRQNDHVPLGKAVLASLAHSREGGREGEREHALRSVCAVWDESQHTIRSVIGQVLGWCITYMDRYIHNQIKHYHTRMVYYLNTVWTSYKGHSE